MVKSHKKSGNSNVSRGHRILSCMHTFWPVCTLQQGCHVAYSRADATSYGQSQRGHSLNLNSTVPYISSSASKLSNSLRLFFLRPSNSFHLHSKPRIHLDKYILKKKILNNNQFLWQTPSVHIQKVSCLVTVGVWFFQQNSCIFLVLFILFYFLLTSCGFSFQHHAKSKQNISFLSYLFLALCRMHRPTAHLLRKMSVIFRICALYVDFKLALYLPW